MTVPDNSSEEFESLLSHALGLAMGGEQAELNRWLDEQGPARAGLVASPNDLVEVGLISLEQASWSQLGEYRLFETLGRGGMGLVYLAMDERLGRKVALKVLRDLGDGEKERVERFHREAKVVASLHHPNLITLLNSGESHGVPWLAFEYVEGMTWHTALQALAMQAPERPQSGAQLGRLLMHDAALPERFAGDYVHACLALALDVARALEAAHRRGVLHRDVKPSNIMLDMHGQARLFDFGLASSAAESNLTRSSTQLGSRRTMPPEQWSRPSYELDVRADVYSLGLTLYQALTLHPAYPQEDEVALRQAVEAGRATPLAALGFSRDLDAVVAHAMEPDRELRYPDVTAFAADLERLQKGLPPEVRRVSAVRRAWSWARRKPIHATAWAMGLLLVTVVPTIFAVQEYNNRQVLDGLLQEQTALRIEADEIAQLSNEAFFALSTSIARWMPVEGAVSERARAALNQSGELLDRAAGVSPLVRARMLASIGHSEFSFEMYAEAEANHRLALSLREAHLPADDPLIVESHLDLAHALHAQQSYTQAGLHYAAALKLAEAPGAELDLEALLEMRQDYVAMLAESHNPATALLEIEANGRLLDDPRVELAPADRLDFILNLARNDIELGDYQRALDWVQTGLDLCAEQLPTETLWPALLRQIGLRAELHLNPLDVQESELLDLGATIQTHLGVRHYFMLQNVSLFARLKWNQGENEAAAQAIADYRAEIKLPQKAVPIQLLILDCYASWANKDFERLRGQVETLHSRLAREDISGLEKMQYEYDVFAAALHDEREAKDLARIADLEVQLKRIDATYAPLLHLEVLANQYLGRFALVRHEIEASQAYVQRAIEIVGRQPAWLARYLPELEADLAAVSAAQLSMVETGL